MQSALLLMLRLELLDPANKNRQARPESSRIRIQSDHWNEALDGSAIHGRHKYSLEVAMNLALANLLASVDGQSISTVVQPSLADLLPGKASTDITPEIGRHGLWDVYLDIRGYSVASWLSGDREKYRTPPERSSLPRELWLDANNEIAVCAELQRPGG